MIHRLVVLDRNKSVGTTLYDDGTLKLQSELLIGLVQALMLLGEELGPSKGALREVELGKYQFGILSEDHLAYIVVQDAYDSEPFTSKILNSVIEEFHKILYKTNMNLKIPDEEKIKKKVASKLTTMKFPRTLLPEIKSLYLEFDVQTDSISDTFLLVDFDDGVIEILRNPPSEKIIKILMEILSEIPFERHWIGESKLVRPKIVNNEEKNYEAWVIYRIGLTDFCFIGRVYYNRGSERDRLINSLDELTNNAFTILTDH